MKYIYYPEIDIIEKKGCVVGNRPMDVILRLKNRFVEMCDVEFK